MKIQSGMLAALLVSLFVASASSLAPSSAVNVSTGLANISIGEDDQDNPSDDLSDNDESKGKGKNNSKSNDKGDDNESTNQPQISNVSINQTLISNESANKTQISNESKIQAQVQQIHNESVNQTQNNNIQSNTTQINNSTNQTENSIKETGNSGSNSKRDRSDSLATSSNNVKESPVVNNTPKKTVVDVSESIGVTTENNMQNTQLNQINLASSIQKMSSFVYSLPGMLATLLVAAVSLVGVIYHKLKKREEFWRDINF